VLRLSRLDARRLHRRAVRLDSPHANIQAAIEHHGFVQIDPINVCGRMHDLILRNRVAGYGEGDLMRHLHGDPAKPFSANERTAFEHHLPNITNILAAMPLEAWPYLLAAMETRSRGTGSWSGGLDARQRELAKVILAEISARGALCSDDIDDEQRDHHGWGARASLAKTTLHKMFFHGRVLIARRVGTRRYYDLPERVLPRRIIQAPEPSQEERERWLTLLKLRQRRLVALSKVEAERVEGLASEINVEDCPLLYCLREDLRLLDERNGGNEPLLLAPLDPLIYDRRVTRSLWGYDYSWEVYTPAAKRIRGYYALPVLAGLELIGHVDPKADRQAKKIRVVNRSIRRGYSTAEAVRRLGRFLGLK
jgi:uncharacterized protein